MATRWKGPLYLALAAGIWGGMYVASKYALQSIPPFTLLFLRYVLASLALLVWCRRRRIRIIPRADRWSLFQIGFLGYFLSIAAQFIGTRLSTAHMGAVITALSPVFQSLFAIVILHEKLSFKQGAAIGVSLAGVMLLSGLSGFGQGEAFNPGNFFFLLAALLWGYYSVLAKKVADGHSALAVTTWGILWATLFALFPAITEWGSWDIRVFVGSLSVLSSVLYIGFVATVIAYYCWNKGLALTRPHQAGLFFFLQPIVGSVLGWLILGEVLTGVFLAGSLLIMAGVFMAMQVS